MKKGICQWTFPDKFSIRECMELAKDAGFEGIELVLGEKSYAVGEAGSRVDKELGTDIYRNDEFTIETSRGDIEKITKMAKEIGIKICSVASTLPFRYPLTSKDENVRKKAIEIAKIALEYVFILGGDTFLLIPGLVTEDVAYPDAYTRAKSAIKELSATAKRFKVNIGIENVWNKFLLSPLEVRNFIDEVNSEYVGAYFDIGNVLISGYPDQWIEILGKRIKKIHIKDFKGEIGNIRGFTTLLNGDLNWPKTIKALERIGYNDFLVAEIMPPYKFYPERLIYETSKSMDIILNK